MYNQKDYIVNRFSIDDFETIKENLEEEFDNFWNKNILESEIRNSNSKYFAIRILNEIIGFGGYIITPQDIEITNIVIGKKYRNKGFGNKLLYEIIEHAKKDISKIDYDPKIISLEVSENNFPAIGLYRKNGFKEVGHRKKYYEGKFDAIIMNLEV